MDNRTSDYGSQRGPGALVRDPLAWAANNARIIAMKLLMEKGARGDTAFMPSTPPPGADHHMGRRLSARLGCRIIGTPKRNHRNQPEMTVRR